MKKLNMYMIIIFSIMIIPFNVSANQVRTIAPDFEQQAYTNTSGVQVYINSTPSQYNSRNSIWYKNINFVNDQSGTWKDSKVTFRYDFSNTTESNVEITIRNAGTMTMVTLDEAPCKFINNSITENYSINCPNPKKQAYLNIFSSESGNDAWVYEGIYFKNEDTISAIDTQTQQQAQQNQIINNTDTSSNSNDFANTINNFSIPNDSHAFDILGGLQGFVSGLSVSSSCRRINIPIPFTNQTLTLPCMTTDVYSVHFPEIVVIWQLLVRGLVYYYIIVNILRLIKETIDPFNFKLEVLDL